MDFSYNSFHKKNCSYNQSWRPITDTEVHGKCIRYCNAGEMIARAAANEAEV
jgi:hypothetical protein